VEKIAHEKFGDTERMNMVVGIHEDAGQDVQESNEGAEGSIALGEESVLGLILGDDEDNSDGEPE